MARDLSVDAAAAVAASAIRLANLVRLEFDSGIVRFWSGIGPLVWDGQTFTGAGQLGAISAAEESAETKATGRVLTLSGISSGMIAIALGEHYQGRFVTSWIALLDSNWALISDPICDFSGRMDVMSVADEGETCTITVSAGNRLIDLERADETSYYTDADQQAKYPGDRGLEFVGALQEAVIIWGRNRVAAGSINAPVSGSAPSAGGGAGGGSGGEGSPIASAGGSLAGP